MSLVFQIDGQFHQWSLYLRMLGKGPLLTTTALLVFFLWLVFEKLVSNLLTIVSDRIARAFKRSGVTHTVTFNISKAFHRVWHAGLLHKLKSMKFQVRYLALFLLF